MSGCWRIEYTNHPVLRRKRREVLERCVAEAIGEIERFMRAREDNFLVFEDLGFAVESIWLPDLRRCHLAVYDLKSLSESWVASIVLDGYPTMGVEEVKRVLRKKGLGEYSIYGLTMTNEKSLGEYIIELEEELRKPSLNELVRRIRAANLKALEFLLKVGIIGAGEGLLDAVKKIEKSMDEKRFYQPRLNMLEHLKL